MKDFQTSHGQRLFRDIALSKDLSHKRMLRIRAFLSGCFRFAKQEGIINHPNPIPDTSVKGRTKTGFVPQAYSLDEIFQVFKILARRDFIVVATAAFTGLRLSELRGLRWRDHRDGKLFVERSVVGTKTGATKTEESQAPVPLVPILDEVLTTYRTWQKKFAGDHDPIFAGERRGNPLNMHNLANRSIKAKFKAAGIPWKGWHAFRRGLSTNLAALGVPPKIAAGILRHSSVQTTLQFYVVSNEPESVAALQKIQDATWGKFGETQDVPQSGSQVRVNNEK